MRSSNHGAMLACGASLSLALACAAADPALAADGVAAADELSRLTLEGLAHVDVTSVSRESEPLPEAAIFVITAEDIRQSGCSAFVRLR